MRFPVLVECANVGCIRSQPGVLLVWWGEPGWFRLQPQPERHAAALLWHSAHVSNAHPGDAQCGPGDGAPPEPGGRGHHLRSHRGHPLHILSQLMSWPVHICLKKLHRQVHWDIMINLLDYRPVIWLLEAWLHVERVVRLHFHPHFNLEKWDILSGLLPNCLNGFRFLEFLVRF